MSAWRRIGLIVVLSLFIFSTGRAESLLQTGNSRWIAIASRTDLDAAIQIATTYQGYKARVVQSENGMYAVVLGPYQTSSMDDFRASFGGPPLPDDAYLAKGKNYSATVWPTGEDDADSTAFLLDIEGAGERSIHLGGDTYYLKFPSQLKFSKRYTKNDREFVDFEGGPYWFHTYSIPYVASKVGRMDIQGYLAEHTAAGDYYIKTIEDGEFTSYGACGSDKKGYCYYFISKVFHEHGTWLQLTVGCQPCSRVDQIATGKFVDNLDDQLRYR